jgi:hypothetical protein
MSDEKAYMNGYVKNKGHIWKHIMKRKVGPGARIDLNDLYAQYGAKYALEPGKEFVEWLKSVKLQDTQTWQVFFFEDGEEVSDVIESEEEEKKVVPEQDDNRRIINKNKLTVDEVVALSVRKARDVVPFINDIQLLKYAEQVAKQRPNKDSLRLILRKRINTLERHVRH